MARPFVLPKGYQRAAGGRVWRRGAALETALRLQVLEKYAQDPTRGAISRIAAKCGLQRKTVAKVVTLFERTGSHLPNAGLAVPRGPSAVLAAPDVIEFIRERVEQLPNVYLVELALAVQQQFNFSISLGYLCHILLHKLHMSKQVLKTPAIQRFTPLNLLKRQIYLNNISMVPPAHMLFFDESGIKVSSGFRPRGYGYRNSQPVQAQPHEKGKNITLNMLVGMRGVLFPQCLPHASNGEHFMKYFQDALAATDDHGNHLIAAGDVIIMDNCRFHHGHSGNFVRVILARYGVHLLYLPPYSPILNPIENVFGVIKQLMKRDPESTFKDPVLSCLLAIEAISLQTIQNFFVHCNYLTHDGQLGALYTDFQGLAQPNEPEVEDGSDEEGESDLSDSESEPEDLFDWDDEEDDEEDDEA